MLYRDTPKTITILVITICKQAPCCNSRTVVTGVISIFQLLASQQIDVLSMILLPDIVLLYFHHITTVISYYNIYVTYTNIILPHPMLLGDTARSFNLHPTIGLRNLPSGFVLRSTVNNVRIICKLLYSSIRYIDSDFYKYYPRCI